MSCFRILLDPRCRLAAISVALTCAQSSAALAVESSNIIHSLAAVADWQRTNLLRHQWHNPDHPVQQLLLNGTVSQASVAVIRQGLAQSRPEAPITVEQLVALHGRLGLPAGNKRVAILGAIELVLLGWSTTHPKPTALRCEGALATLPPGTATQLGTQFGPDRDDLVVYHQPHNSALLFVGGDVIHAAPVKPIQAALRNWLRPAAGDPLGQVLDSESFGRCRIPLQWLLGDAPLSGAH